MQPKSSGCITDPAFITPNPVIRVPGSIPKITSSFLSVGDDTDSSLATYCHIGMQIKFLCLRRGCFLFC